MRDRTPRGGARDELQLGMVGLGRMGANIVRRLMRDGHECVVYDINPDAIKDLADEGAIGASSLEELAEKLKPPRSVWVMVPAGEITESTVHEVADAAREGRRDHRRRQLLLPRRHPPLGRGRPSRASTTSTAAPAAASSASSAATA